MKRNYLLILASVLTPLLVSGQSYYDDDIYYNPSKVKKTEKREVKKQKTEGTADFEEPTYQVYTSNPRDVDEYNRRGAYKVSADTISADTVVANPDVFQYTERMERFDNPTIVVSSDDSRLKELYYADNVNIYVGTPRLHGRLADSMIRGTARATGRHGTTIRGLVIWMGMLSPVLRMV